MREGKVGVRLPTRSAERERPQSGTTTRSPETHKAPHCPLLANSTISPDLDIPYILVQVDDRNRLINHEQSSKYFLITPSPQM